MEMSKIDETIRKIQKDIEKAGSSEGDRQENR
jgi:hypothetical protein